MTKINGPIHECLMCKYCFKCHMCYELCEQSYRSGFVGSEYLESSQEHKAKISQQKTLRDEFACAALITLHNLISDSFQDSLEIAKVAYEIADGMMKARESK